MLKAIVDEVRQTGKAYRQGPVNEMVLFFAHFNGLNYYFSRKTGATYFSESLREAQLLATRHR